MGKTFNNKNIYSLGADVLRKLIRKISDSRRRNYPENRENYAFSSPTCFRANKQVNYDRMLRVAVTGEATN
jgi:hypothetical protein